MSTFVHFDLVIGLILLTLIHFLLPPNSSSCEIGAHHIQISSDPQEAMGLSLFSEMVIDLSIAKDCRDSSPQIYAQTLPDLYQGG